MSNLESVVADTRAKLSSRVDAITHLINNTVDTTLSMIKDEIGYHSSVDATSELQKYRFHCNIDSELSWIFDAKKGFHSNPNRGQSAQQWVNSSVARKYANGFNFNLLLSLKQYARDFAVAIESQPDPQRLLCSFICSQFYYDAITSSIASGKGAGNRPVVCDGSYKPKKSKMWLELTANIDSALVANVSSDQRQRKQFVIDYYKKQSMRHWTQYVKYHISGNSNSNSNSSNSSDLAQQFQILAQQCCALENENKSLKVYCEQQQQMLQEQERQLFQLRCVHNNGNNVVTTTVAEQLPFSTQPQLSGVVDTDTDSVPMATVSTFEPYTFDAPPPIPDLRQSGPPFMFADNCDFNLMEANNSDLFNLWPPNDDHRIDYMNFEMDIDIDTEL